ncbi:TPA: LysR family transcriptional regulator, partial [Enterobacter cloacae]
MLSLTQLAAYVAIIETGTFQKAAERLGVSQPTVSQSLRNL